MNKEDIKKNIKNMEEGSVLIDTWKTEDCGYILTYSKKSLIQEAYFVRGGVYILEVEKIDDNEEMDLEVYGVYTKHTLNDLVNLLEKKKIERWVVEE